MYEVIGYAASFCVGLILGLIGGGGSILAVPILIYLFSLEVIDATAYSLFIVGTTSLIGSILRHRNHYVNFEVGLLFGIPALLSKLWVRGWGMHLIPEILIETDAILITRRYFILSLFSGLVILAAISMIVKRPILERDLIPPKPYWIIFLGVIIGLVTGIVGIGGGFLIVPTLYCIAKLPFKSAVGTALFIIAISSLIGFIGDAIQIEINWAFLFVLTGIAVLGIITGNFYSKLLSSLQLRRIFAWVILLMGIFILTKETLL